VGSLLLKRKIGKADRKWHYPPIILTFWSAFETFVRYTSELMLITVRGVPEIVGDYLRDLQQVVSHGKTTRITRHQNVIDRYETLLRYGYSLEVNRGNKYWQDLKAANELRDYYTHLDVTNPRSITTAELEQFMESILLGIITPSVLLRRTLLLGVYNMHSLLCGLRKLAEDFTEEPFFKDWPTDEGYMFHCNFGNVDDGRFPAEGRLKGKWPGLDGQDHG
jgi:hypothetical protein